MLSGWKGFICAALQPLRLTGRSIKQHWGQLNLFTGSTGKDTTDAIGELKERGYRIFSVEQTEGATSLEDLQLSQIRNMPLYLVMRFGGWISRWLTLSDLCIEIPQYGTKHSLNISVAAGIVIWELFRKFSL